jgi:CII-binding regulator of phage lambda lysogenization HflD
MKKIIRLTESDLTRIVKRVMNEGGYESIEKEMKNRSIASKGATGLFGMISKLMIGFGKFKSMLKGDSFEYAQYKVASKLMDDFLDLRETLSILKQLVSSFEKRDMKLRKSDFEDYDIDLESLLNKLSEIYDKIRELEEMTDDDATIKNLNALEKLLDKIVDLLDNIED